MRRSATVLSIMVLLGAGLTLAAAPAATSASCSTTWGSLPKASADSTYRPLENIRTGRHDCFDRMVFDVRGATSATPVGYRVEYVSELRQDGSGKPVPVDGGAVMEVRVAAPSYDPETGGQTYPGQAGKALPGVDLTGYRTFRDARFASSFEGDTQVGLGVRARLPFRVFQTGGHVVVDVAHTWAATS
ncbi:AMIN-like domain-containing (lipo)protein [Streptomyces sparsus]